MGTAGSKQKRAYLRTLQVHAAINSRSTDFATELGISQKVNRPQTVLNSLTSPGHFSSPADAQYLSFQDALQAQESLEIAARGTLTGLVIVLLPGKTFPSAGMVAASLACLGGGGSFVEVGKRDIWSPQRVAQERPDIKYHLVAIDFWEPSVVESSLQRLAGMLARGTPAFNKELCSSFAGIVVISAFSELLP